LTEITYDIFVCVVGVWQLPNTDYAHKDAPYHWVVEHLDKNKRTRPTTL